ncbi:hypothetical protein niasHS_005250 [Heterodera schachtii]|uniref:Uncharacterized protein n=1 Tax=Heterodera schachtii TaxID=97005 RepID=A0ABD2JQD9_HETSC
MPSASGTVLFFGYSFFTFELFTYGIVFAIVCLNLAVICPTKILHFNLKSILITQSGAEMLYVLVRSVMLLQKFTSDDPFAPANPILQGIIIFNSLFRRFLGHVLIIERYLATIYTSSYESYSKIRFTFTWFIITFMIAFVNTVTNGQSWTFTQFNMITQTMSTVISAATELTIMTHHQLLKRRLIILLKKMFNLNQNQIGDMPTNTMELAPSAANPTNGRDEMDAHFKMLLQLWNK